jgi:hypothetical protein
MPVSGAMEELPEDLMRQGITNARCLRVLASFRPLGGFTHPTLGHLTHRCRTSSGDNEAYHD